MEYLGTAGLLALPLVIGGWVVWLGMGRPGLAEFIDRPVCWLVGHDLTHPLYTTTYPYQDRTWDAVVWRCSRHAMPVIVI